MVCIRVQLETQLPQDEGTGAADFPALFTFLKASRPLSQIFSMLFQHFF